MALFDCKGCAARDETVQILREENRELRRTLIAMKAGPSMLDKIHAAARTEELEHEAERVTEDSVVGTVGGVPVKASAVAKRFHEVHGGAFGLAGVRVQDDGES